MTSIINSSNSNSALINTINASDSKHNPNVYSTKKIYPAAATTYVTTTKSSGSVGANQTIVFDGVLADGTPNTKAVFLGQGTGPDAVNYGAGYYRNTYRGISENFIQNASWFRLRSLGLTYALPTRFFDKIFIKNASINATANNLFLITKYKGYDPETSSTPSGSNVTAFSGFTYPAMRSFLFTLNVGF